VEALRRLPRPEIAFNYLGQLDLALSSGGSFRPASESHGPMHAAEGRRPFAIEVYGMVQERRLALTFEYSETLHERQRVERLAADFAASLRALIAHCLAPDAGGYTASDFAQYDWSQQDLDAITALIQKSQSGA
jgi:non-ribosomal peptide synthase protein (TIGR01720 family)